MRLLLALSCQTLVSSCLAALSVAQHLVCGHLNGNREQRTPDGQWTILFSMQPGVGCVGRIFCKEYAHAYFLNYLTCACNPTKLNIIILKSLETTAALVHRYLQVANRKCEADVQLRRHDSFGVDAR